MTIGLIKMLIWGTGDANSIDSIEVEPYEVEFNRSSDEDKNTYTKSGVIEEVDVQVDEEEEEREEGEEGEEDGDEDEDKYPDYPHSRLDFEFNKCVEEFDYRPLMLCVYGMCFVGMVGFMSYPIYELVLESYIANSSSIILYSASIQSECSRFLAHLPYIPTFLLCTSYAYPEIIDTLNVNTSSDAITIRLFLWFQFILQGFASFGRSMGPLIFEEMMLILGTAMFYVLFQLATPTTTSVMIDIDRFATLLHVLVAGYLLYGLNTVLFIIFGLIVVLQPFVRDAFSLITSEGYTILLYTAVPVLVANVLCIVVPSSQIVCDILLFQVMGSVVDFIIISPRPGMLLLSYTEDEEEEGDEEEEECDEEEEEEEEKTEVIKK